MSLFFDDFKEEWLEHLKEQGFKFFVLKAADFLSALTLDEVEQFNAMLKKCETYRESIGKKSFNNYWVVNRDEAYATEVKKLIEKNHNIVLKE